MKICIDPGHGLGNRRAGVYDPGATVMTSGGREITEAEVVMMWAKIAVAHGYSVMVSLHCNAASGTAHGTETFYRGAANQALALGCNEAVRAALGTRDRGVKTEEASQHARLAVLSFKRVCLIELGFIDHAGDRAAMLDAGKMEAACQALAKVITAG